jgi:hypothetical protein
MAEKSSENENKVFAMTLTQPCKSGRNHPKAWKCGRGEVSLAKVELTPLSINFIPTFPFFVNDCFKRSM